MVVNGYITYRLALEISIEIVVVININILINNSFTPKNTLPLS